MDVKLIAKKYIEEEIFSCLYRIGVDAYLVVFLPVFPGDQKEPTLRRIGFHEAIEYWEESFPPITNWEEAFMQVQLWLDQGWTDPHFQTGEWDNSVDIPVRVEPEIDDADDDLIGWKTLARLAGRKG